MRALTDKWIETQIRKALSRASFALSGLARFVATSTGGALVGQAVKITGAGTKPQTATVALAQGNNAANEASGVVLAYVGSIAIVVAQGEVVAYFGALTPGAVYYLDPTTPGAITAVRPTTPNIAQVIGRAVDSSTLLVDVVPTETAPSSIVLAGNVVGPSSATRVVGLSGDSVTKLVVQDSGVSIACTQGGTAGAPTTDYPQNWQPSDPARAAF